MTKYSITRLNCYRECPYKYKLKYIDGVEDPFKSTDATFLGSMCHEALEYLYKARMGGRDPSKEEFLGFYNDNWKANYSTDRIMHVDENYGEDYYRLQGEGMLSRYYTDIFLRDDKTVLGVETDDVLTLPDGNTYYVRIDRLAYRDGVYYVCDYKTDKKAKTQSAADEDRQLAMYAAWVRKNFPDAKDVRLVWHMLRFDGGQATVESSRTPEQLQGLVDETVKLIEEIETATEFPIGEDPHCDYCTYKSICPKFVPPKILTIEDGMELVDELMEKDTEKKLLEKRIAEIKSELVALAESSGYDVISGTDYEVPIKRFPTADKEGSDWDSFSRKVRNSGLSEEYLMLNHSRIRADITKGILPPDLIACLVIQDSVSTGNARKRKNLGEE